jgi:FkbM family methyltransferase
MNKLFLEIGSADFDTCLPLAKAGWSGISIEPVPYLFERVRKQYEGYDVRVGNYAISDRIGSVKMAVAREDGWLTGCSHVVSDNHLGYKLSTNPDRLEDFDLIIDVDCMTLDDLLFSVPQSKQIDFMKVDTEGHELNIFMNYSFRIKPRFVKIEHKHVDDTLLTRKLEENGYLVWTEESDIYGIV